jgi:hypothetical protein
MSVSFTVFFKKKVPPYETLGGDHFNLAEKYQLIS